MKKIVFTLCFLGLSIAQAKTLTCIGTEPFWNASLNMETGITKITDMEEVSHTIKTKIKNASGTTGDYAFAAVGKFVTFAVTANSTCTDGMSDNTYTHSVLLLGYGGTPLVGCCR